MLGALNPAYGIDIDRDACCTAQAAGHQRIRADVATFPLEQLVGRVDGAILSPPCKDWSVTGSGAGYDGATGHLLREPLRWCLTLRPRWTAWECTAEPAVRARFTADAAVLRRAGYHAWTGVLNAVDYGVPSTRKRAILIAHAERPVGPPPPMPGPVATMADALGWDGAEPSPTTAPTATPAGGAAERCICRRSR